MAALDALDVPVQVQILAPQLGEQAANYACAIRAPKPVTA